MFVTFITLAIHVIHISLQFAILIIAKLLFHSVAKSWTAYGAHVNRSICSSFAWILNNGYQGKNRLL